MSKLGLTVEDLDEFIGKKDERMNTDDHLDAIRYSMERDLQVKIGVDDDRIEWAKLCLKECQGITKEALEKGVISFALDWLMTHDLIKPDLLRDKEIFKKKATFMGVKIWDPKS